MIITVENHTLRADFAPKAVRRALTAVAEHGIDGVTILVLGKLDPRMEMLEAGLVAQPKAPKPTGATTATSANDKPYQAAQPAIRSLRRGARRHG
jgi:hypothetical protein